MASTDMAVDLSLDASECRAAIDEIRAKLEGRDVPPEIRAEIERMDRERDLVGDVEFGRGVVVARPSASLLALVERVRGL